MSDRFRYEEDEAKYPWLMILLNAYHVSDSLVTEYLSTLLEQGLFVACHQGCHACCLNSTVPITHLELMGISWYAGEKLQGNARQVVKERLYTHQTRNECPFLVDTTCSIYPLRPISCRQFFVKSRSCEITEDVSQTRPSDIIFLPARIAKATAMEILEFYDFHGDNEKDQAFENGFIFHNSKPMNLLDLSHVACTMDNYDDKI